MTSHWPTLGRPDDGLQGWRAIRAPVLTVCAAAYGLALAWAGVQIAAREAEAKLPELCQTAIRSTI